MPEASLTNWWIAYVVTMVVVALVVVLVAAILEYARRIGKQALEITETLDEIRLGTMRLWEVSTVTNGLNKAADTLGSARGEPGTR